MKLETRCPSCDSEGPHETTTKGPLASYDTINTTSCPCGLSENTAAFTIHALVHEVEAFREEAIGAFTQLTLAQTESEKLRTALVTMTEAVEALFRNAEAHAGAHACRARTLSTHAKIVAASFDEGEP